MATVIRLKPGGRTHEPYYRVVVADSRNKLTGKVIDQIGIYQPCARPEPVIEIDGQKALQWLKKGARLTPTTRNILSKKGIIAAHANGVSPEDFAPAETETETGTETVATESEG